MRMNEQEIRESMDRRLSSLEASAVRRARIRQRIDREEEPIMKRKLTLGLALAMAMLLALTGVAVAAGVNLFEHFADKDARVGHLAGQASLETQVPVQAETDPLGATHASISNAYYDGQSLIVAYSILNDSLIEEFTPTEEQKSAMTKCNDTGAWAVRDEEDAAYMAELIRARKEGFAYGLKMHSIYPSDHTEAFGEIDLPPMTERQETADDGSTYFLREYESPLPEEAQDKDRLDIQIRLKETVSYLWFDGKDMYTLPGEHGEIGKMTASVLRTDAATQAYSGEGTYQTASVRAEASLSAVTGEITLSGENAFPALSPDEWYSVLLTDEAGRTLKVTQTLASDEDTLSFSFSGTGLIPESLSATVLVEREGADTAAEQVIVLNRDK